MNINKAHTVDTRSRSFYEWEARTYEYYQLRWRYRWLVWRNDIFNQDLREADEQAMREGIIGTFDPISGREIKAEDIRLSFQEKWRGYHEKDESAGAPKYPLHHDDLLVIYHSEHLPTPGHERIDRWLFGYVMPADEIEQLETLTVHAEHETGRTFLLKYGLIPAGVEHPIQREFLAPFERNGLLPKGSFNLDFELNQIEKIAQKQGWSIKTTLFDLHAWWYEMAKEAKMSYAEIARLTDEFDSSFVDRGALRYMQSNYRDREYKELCRLVYAQKSEILDGLPEIERLLVFLGRIKIGIGKDDFGIVTGWPYEPVIGRGKEIRKNLKYYLPPEFPFELVQYFEELKIPMAAGKVLDDFEQFRDDYMAGGSNSLIESAIRTAVHYMQKKIDAVVPLGTTT